MIYFTADHHDDHDDADGHQHVAPLLPEAAGSRSRISHGGASSRPGAVSSHTASAALPLRRYTSARIVDIAS
jgi:hypothetical protein